jgi:hypothetical protein
MEVQEIEVCYGRTVQLVKFNPSRFELRIRVKPDKDEKHHDCIARANAFLHKELEILIQKEVEFLKGK